MSDEPILFGPDGRRITRGTRTHEQIEWDRQFRQQMADNGGQAFPPQFIDAIKAQIDRRDQAKREATAAQDGARSERLGKYF